MLVLLVRAAVVVSITRVVSARLGHHVRLEGVLAQIVIVAAASALGRAIVG